MTKHRNQILLALCAAALLGAAAAGRAAIPFTLNFDGPGSTADDFAPVSLTIGYGQFVPTLDEFGDPIPGTEHWELDLGGGPVPVIDPSTVGYDPAPSLFKALDARDGTVLLVFDTPELIGGFSATLDNSTFGNLSDSPVEFYDSSFILLASISADQTVPGLILTSGLISGAVKTIVLPSTAFYDNIAAVPETDAWSIAMLGIIGVASLFRRGRRKS